jgi:rod shape-determining protein MreC
MVLTRQRTLPLLVITCLGHVLLISAQVQSRQGVPLIEGAAFGVFARIQLATASVADRVGSLWTNYFALSGAARENEDLRRRVVELEGDLQAERARARQVPALEEALGLASVVPARTVSARVIAGSPAPGQFTVVIDRGTDDGVRPDMAVIAADGVVGRVVGTPSRSAATVQLLISTNTAAAARLASSGAGGIVRGGPGDPPLSMDYVSNQAAVPTGEQVVTSGLDQVYPPGFVIGTVESATLGADLYQEIRVRPAVDFSNLQIVLVVLEAPAAVEGGGR